MDTDGAGKTQGSSAASKLGFWSIVLLGINSIIGPAIFLLPGKIYALDGTMSIVAVLFDMFLAMAIALCYAEASGMFKRDGGPYLYTKYSLGEFAGFEVGTVKWFIMSIVWGTNAVGFATALGTVVPSLSDPTSISVVSTCLIIGMALLNIGGVSELKVLDNITTIGKLVPLALFILVGLFFMKGVNFQPLLPERVFSGNNFSAAAVLFFFAFTGFEALAISAKDMKNPEKNLPGATIVSVLVISAVYLLSVCVCIGILGPRLAYQVAPLQEAFHSSLGLIGKYFIVAGTLIATFGATLAASFYSPRECISIAEDGMLPKALSKNSRFGTPALAICCSAAIASVVTWGGDFTRLATICAIAKFSEYIPTCLCIPIYRIKWAQKARAFKIPFGWLIPALAIVASLWLITQSSWHEIAWGFSPLLIVLPLYFPYLIRKEEVRLERRREEHRRRKKMKK